MRWIRTLGNRLADERLRTATLVGLASVPVSVVFSLDSGPDHLSLTPVLYAGLLVGYLYSERPTASGQAGVRTGLVGALPLLWTVSDGLVTGWSASPRYGAIATVFALLFLVLGSALSALAGAIGALIGDWLARATSRLRPTGVVP